MKGNLKTLTDRAKFMKKTIPNLKILVIVCDPAKRYISHQKHMLVGYRATALPLDKAEIKLVANVQRDVKKLVADKFRPSAADYTKKSKITRNYDDYLAYGNYFTQLQPFLKEFSLENFHFMDGTRMATSDALDEAQKFEDF